MFLVRKAYEGHYDLTGYGDTHEEAIQKYARAISNRTIIANNLEVNVPILEISNAYQKEYITNGNIITRQDEKGRWFTHRKKYQDRGCGHTELEALTDMCKKEV